MIVSVAIVLVYLPVTASQCVDILQDKNQCMRGRVASQTTETVLGCMERCLTQNRDRCRYSQWNVKTKDCILSKRIGPLSGIGDCITIKKLSCSRIYDSVCFKPTSGNVFKGNNELSGLSQEEECKTLCMFMVSCQAYTWFVRTSRCRIHRRTIQSGEKLQKGDMQAMKMSSCPAGRCVTLKVSTFSYAGHEEGTVTGIGDCMTSSLNTTAVQKVDWNTNDESCWSHTAGNYEEAVAGDDKILQLVKAMLCRMTRQNVCMKKRKHVGMSDGYKIAAVFEEDCVSLCYVVANCAAVELDENKVDCVVHFVKTEIKEMPDHTLYVAHDCSVDQEESTSVPTTSTASSSTVTQTTTPIPASPRQKAEGTFRWSYYIRHSGHTEKATRRACLECALLCQRTNCTGFSCEDNANGKGCNVNVKGDPMFSRTRLRPGQLEIQEGD